MGLETCAWGCFLVTLILCFVPYYRPVGDVKIVKTWTTTEVDKHFGTPTRTYQLDHFLISYRYYGMSPVFTCEINDDDNSNFHPAQDCEHACEAGDAVKGMIFANQYSSTDCDVPDIEGIFLLLCGWGILVFAFILALVLLGSGVTWIFMYIQDLSCCKNVSSTIRRSSTTTADLSLSSISYK